MDILSSLQIGQRAEIGKINVKHAKKIKLLGLGINTGAHISILRNRGGDMVLALGNARVSLGRTLSNLIEVRSL